jgi:hypothetical protein
MLNIKSIFFHLWERWSQTLGNLGFLEKERFGPEGSSSSKYLFVEKQFKDN